MARILVRSSLVLLLAVSFVGCFRYTPSRREMAKDSDDKIAGPEAFTAYQADLQKRLEDLIKERAELLGSDSASSYKLGPKDIVKIDVFGFSDLSGESEVSESGTVSLPLIGDVQASGYTPTGFQTELTEKYKRYVKKPVVRVSVNSFNAYKVSVVGAVVKPGWVSLKRPGYLLTDLLSEVGGVRDNASGRIYLIPAQPGSTLPIPQGLTAPGAKAGVEIDLEQLTGTLDRPPIMVPLVSGDIVIVPEAGQFRVDGEVERPGSFGVSRRTSTLSAVAAAGGFTYAANVNEVEVIRDIGGGKKASMTVDMEKVAFHGEPDISLRDGDVVLVPSASGRFRTRQIVETFRSLLRGGASVRYQQ